VSRFFDRISRLEDALRSEPSVDLFREQVQPLLIEDQAARFFFSKVQDPSWLDVFNECGLFDDIPRPEASGKDGVLRYPTWYPVWALENLASEAAHEVMEILLELPITDNETVHTALLRTAHAAAKAAPDLVEEWVSKKESKWLKGATHLDLLLADAAVKLVEALCPEHCGSAIELGESIISIRVPEDAEDLKRSDYLRMGEWEFGEIVSRLREPLTRCSWRELLRIVVATLSGLAGGPDPRELDQRLLIWRPAIEEHSQNSPNSLFNTLVGVARDAAVQALEDGDSEVAAFLRASTYATLHRIAIHLGRTEWEILGNETAEFAVGEEKLVDLAVWHELFLLLEQRFDSFPPESADRYLRYVSSLDSEEEQWRYLWPIRETLSGEWRKRFEALETRHEEPEHPDFLTYHIAEIVETTSPWSAEEAADTDIAAIIGIIRDAKPTDRFGSPSLSGVADQLEHLVTLRTREVTENAMAFSGLQIPYLRAFVRGAIKAVGENAEGVQWSSLLDLCRWVLDQPSETQDVRAEKSSPSYGWEETRLEVARLLEKGLQQGSARIPDDLLGKMWIPVQKLLVDSDPTNEREEERLKHEEPSHIAINSVRGTAMQLLLYYAFRRRGALGESQPYPALSACAPEVVEELDLHLDPTKEPSLAVHSIYGKWYPQLYGLDKEWALARREAIFPASDTIRLDSAWNAYLAFSRVYADIYQALHSVYEHALKRVRTQPSELKTLVDPDERLGGHLVLLYRHGEIELDGGHLEAFFAAADAELRFQVLSAAVRGLDDLEEADQEDACTSLSRLWDWRVDHQEHPAEGKELSAFCWWFIKDAFDDAWAVQQLAFSLNGGAELELDGHVLKKLLRLVPSHTEIVLECVEAIAKDQRNLRWGIYREEMEEILKIGLSSSDGQNRMKAEELVHSIGAQGFFGLRDLLSS